MGLLVIYQLLISFTPGNMTPVAQSYAQKNRILAQEYQHSVMNYDYVLLGTSISEGLKIDVEGESSYTLNLIGGSVLTALELIKRKKALPAALIIETNLADRSSDMALVQNTTHPVLVQLRENFSLLREANQPVNKMADNPMQKLPEYSVVETPKYHSDRLQTIITDYDNRVDTAALRSCIRQMNEYLNYFTEKGVRIYLVEVPVDPALQQTFRYQKTRQYLGKLITGKAVMRVPLYSQPVSGSDGLHLDAKSRNEFSLFLSSWLER